MDLLDADYRILQRCWIFLSNPLFFPKCLCLHLFYYAVRLMRVWSHTLAELFFHGGLMFVLQLFWRIFLCEINTFFMLPQISLVQSMQSSKAVSLQIFLFSLYLKIFKNWLFSVWTTDDKSKKIPCFVSYNCFKEIISTN